MDTRDVLIAGTVGSLLLLFLSVCSPFMIPPGSRIGLDGSPAFIDHGWNGLADLGYFIGDILCHQQYDRSFVINGNQLPLCIRDIGLLTGLILGLLLCLTGKLDRHVGRLLVPGILLVSLTGMEWYLESIVGDMPSVRLFSGIVSGAGAALILFWMMERNEATGRQYA